MSQPFTITPGAKRLILQEEVGPPNADGLWHPYWDYSQYSIFAGMGIHPDGGPVTQFSRPITYEEGMVAFEKTVLPIYVKGVQNVVQRTDLPVAALSALVSFAYNLGVSALANSSLLIRIEESKWGDVAFQWSRWVFTNPADINVSARLCLRRQREYVMFRDAVISSGLGTVQNFNIVWEQRDHQNGSPRPDYELNTGWGTLYRKDFREGFCSLKEVQSQPVIVKRPWIRLPIYNSSGDIIGWNPGKWYPNEPPSNVNDATPTVDEASQQGVEINLPTSDEINNFVTPPFAGGFPVAHIQTQGGNGPFPRAPASPGATSVLINGQPANVQGDTRLWYPVGNQAAVPVNIEGDETVLVEGKPLVRELHKTNDGPGGVGIVGPGGSQNVFCGFR